MKSLWLKWMSAASLNLSQRKEKNPCLIAFTKTGAARMPTESSLQSDFTGISVQKPHFLPCVERIKSNTQSQSYNSFLVFFFFSFNSLNADMRQMLDLKMQLSVSNESGIHALHCAASPFLYYQLVCFLPPYELGLPVPWCSYYDSDIASCLNHPIPLDLEF